jgi:FMN-binding domain
MKRNMSVKALRAIALVALAGMSGWVWARGVYQEPEAFISEAFAGKPPAVKVVWLAAAMQPEIMRILGHPYVQQRVRYWQEGARSAWVLEETGKEEPITTGIIVNQGRIEMVKVLIYRESRGDEVRYPAFTRQFKGATLTAQQELDRSIDGISGATLSSHALTRLARLALYLDAASREPK